MIFSGSFPRSLARRDTGFTLIELLIVVGIISILASIATPNFLEAQTRAKVSRVANDARALAVALEAYAVDLNRYPPRRPASTSLGWAQGFGRCDSRLSDITGLTTPISYISTIPVDVFLDRNEQPNNVLDYWSPELMRDLIGGTRLPNAKSKYPGFVISSVGPDGSLGYGTINYVGCVRLSASDPRAGSIYRVYDATNGTISLGNLFRLQSGGAPVEVFYTSGGGY